MTVFARVFSRRRLLASTAQVAAFAALPVILPRDRLAIQPQPPVLDRLRTQWKAEIANHSFSTAVSALDLQTGEAVDVNGDVPRETGCTLNLFVIMSVVRDLQAGLYPESDVGGIITHTIENSSAQGGRNLLVKTGGGDVMRGIDKVNDLIKSLGLSKTLYDHAPGFPDESRFGGADNTTTANDTRSALAALWSNRVVAHEWTVYLLDKMTQVKPGLNYLIPAGVPGGAGARVGHKNGFVLHPIRAWVDDDIGIVWRFVSPEKQYAYAVSIFFQDVPTKYANVPLGQRLSSLAWDAFAAKNG